VFHHTLPQLYALSTQEGKLVLRLEIVAVYRECGASGRRPGGFPSPAIP